MCNNSCCQAHCITLGDILSKLFRRCSSCGCGCGCAKKCFATEMQPSEPIIEKRCVCHEEEVLVPQPDIAVQVEVPCPPAPSCGCGC